MSRTVSFALLLFVVSVSVVVGVAVADRLDSSVPSPARVTVSFFPSTGS